MAKATGHRWQFRARFRRHAFGWKSQPAITRVKEAVSEITKVARKDPNLAANGAVLLIEKLPPALERVDGSSGAMGTAVNNAIAKLAQIIAKAPADTKTREKWLERLFEAHACDERPFIERLADHWGNLCASKELASQWADRLLDVTRMALSPDKNLRGFFHGTSACLSALYAAERHDDLRELLAQERFWPYRRWAVMSLIAQGRRAEALREAESCRSRWASDYEIDGLCEQILLSSGLAEEAYRKYGLTANRANTYVAWFRTVTKKYPQKPPGEILADLVKLTPGQEGKWFAAAKSAGFFDEAIELANQSPCAPQTLIRSARDFEKFRPDFALEAGIAALRWLTEGYGYEITSVDVLDAYRHTTQAAENAGCSDETMQRIRDIVAAEPPGERFVTKVLGSRLGLT